MAPPTPHVLLFTGHMLDQPHRTTPRFPLGQEDVAQRAIHDAVKQEKQRADRPLLGIAGGASGGDILFHEVCNALGAPTEVYLTLPPAAYLETSVAYAGPAWIQRFHHLIETRPVHILENASPDDPSIWSRTNRWMLHEAEVYSGGHLTLIALWDGRIGNGPGGTDDLVEQARQRGIRSIILDTNTLFET